MEACALCVADGDEETGLTNVLTDADGDGERDADVDVACTGTGVAVSTVPSVCTCRALAYGRLRFFVVFVAGVT